MKDVIRNLPHSILTKLKNFSRENNFEFNVVLIRFAIERFLYRLYLSEYRDNFVLKGGNLLTVWLGPSYRVTKDADFLFSGEASHENLKKCFTAVCNIEFLEDAIEFHPETILTTEIRKEKQYNGICVELLATIGVVKIPLGFDVGFGDAVYPEIQMKKFPTCLALPPPQIQMYPEESVISEKFEAMVSLGIANSRMKDFYDIWLLSEEFDFQYSLLREAIRQTFERRRTDLPKENLPLALTPEFFKNPIKQKQWNAFLRKAKAKNAPETFSEVAQRLITFLSPFIFEPTDKKFWSKVKKTWQ